MTMLESQLAGAVQIMLEVSRVKMVGDPLESTSTSSLALNLCNYLHLCRIRLITVETAQHTSTKSRTTF
jgi:hypothetical protein